MNTKGFAKQTFVQIVGGISAAAIAALMIAIGAKIFPL
jgi:hypothetical protein